MSDPIAEKINNNPKYQELKAKRNRFGWTLTIIMLIVAIVAVAGTQLGWW